VGPSSGGERQAERRMGARAGAGNIADASQSRTRAHPMRPPLRAAAEPTSPIATPAIATSASTGAPAYVPLVRESWRALAPRGDVLAARFQARVLERVPGARALFAGADLAVHGRRLVALLAHAVVHLDRPDVLRPAIAALGRRHAAYGVAAADYDAVGAALLHAIGETLGGAATAEVLGAWREAYTLLADVMREGAACRADGHEADGR
jgi:hemoglobin-like flavoprotein